MLSFASPGGLVTLSQVGSARFLDLRIKTLGPSRDVVGTMSRERTYRNEMYAHCGRNVERMAPIRVRKILLVRVRSRLRSSMILLTRKVPFLLTATH